MMGILFTFSIVFIPMMNLNSMNVKINIDPNERNPNASIIHLNFRVTDVYFVGSLATLKVNQNNNLIS